MLELVLNHPIDYELLKRLYVNKEDLVLAWPEAKYPLCSKEWSNFVNSGLEAASLLFKRGSIFAGHALLRSNDQGQLYLCFVLLSRPFRGQGLIYKMLEAAEVFAHQNFPHEEILLNVDPSNYPALRAYKKHGYKKIAVTDKGRYRMSKKIKIMPSREF